MLALYSATISKMCYMVMRAKRKNAVGQAVWGGGGEGVSWGLQLPFQQ